MRKVYLDHNATTPVRPEVFEAMKKVLTDFWGNPSSSNWAGAESSEYLVRAREQVAAFIGAEPEEIVFTGGGSEADNLAIKGVAGQYTKKGKHIVTSVVEHPAVHETVEYMADHGYGATFLGVDNLGMIDIDKYADALRDDTLIVSVMMANNETGNIYPIKKMAELANKKGIFFHTDAVQAAGKIPINVKELGVDLLSLSGHKFYGPKGIGVLYVRRGIKLEKLVHGGGQEGGRRAGTENMPGIVGVGMAAELAMKELPTESPRILKLRNRFEEAILKTVPDTRRNGHPTDRLPNTSNITLKGVEGESILLTLDMDGVAVSAGSACASGAGGPSRTLVEMGICEEEAQSAIRFSFGKSNTEDDVDYALKVVPPVIEKLRKMSPLYRNRAG